MPRPSKKRAKKSGKTISRPKNSKVSFQDSVKNLFSRLGLAFLDKDIEVRDKAGKAEGDFDLLFSLGENTLVFVETTEATNDLGGHFGKKW